MTVFTLNDGDEGIERAEHEAVGLDPSRLGISTTPKFEPGSGEVEAFVASKGFLVPESLVAYPSSATTTTPMSMEKRG